MLATSANIRKEGMKRKYPRWFSTEERTFPRRPCPEGCFRSSEPVSFGGAAGDFVSRLQVFPERDSVHVRDLDHLAAIP